MKMPFYMLSKEDFLRVREEIATLESELEGYRTGTKLSEMIKLQAECDSYKEDIENLLETIQLERASMKRLEKENRELRSTMSAVLQKLEEVSKTVKRNNAYNIAELQFSDFLDTRV